MAQKRHLIKQDSKLETVNAKLDLIIDKVDRNEDKIDRVSSSVKELHQNLEQKISKIDKQLRKMAEANDFCAFFDKKEAELTSLKAQLRGMRSDIHYSSPFEPPPKFHQPPPRKPTSPTRSFPSPPPDAGIAIFSNVYNKPKKEKQPKSPSSSPPSPTMSLDSPPPRRKDKQPMSEMMVLKNSFSSLDDVNSIVIDELEEESSSDDSRLPEESSSDSEKEFHDITAVLMATNQSTSGAGPSTQQQTQAYADLPSSDESSPEDAPGVTTENPGVVPKAPRNGPWFTFDNVPVQARRDRMQEISAWVDLQRP